MPKHPLIHSLEDVHRMRAAERPLFDLGQVVCTPGAELVIEALDLPKFWVVQPHRYGEWGDLDAHDKAMNDQALLNGGRIFSAYNLNDAKTGATVRIYVITEAVNESTGVRDSTCVLRADEY